MQPARSRPGTCWRQATCAKSPADGGLPPYELDGLLGCTLVRPLGEDEAVLAADVARVPSPAAAT